MTYRICLLFLTHRHTLTPTKRGIAIVIKSTLYIKNKTVVLTDIYTSHGATNCLLVNSSHLAKMKSTFLTYPHHKIYCVEAVGPKSLHYTMCTLKITIFVNKYYVKFGLIS